ncbi:hypothetical protein Acsp01_10000 [Actinoplanes sp. NBRC 101535]|nr:hypothetical protein Acsp01_10000 [Actinoplanes sp. NBRC 101535]
MINAVTGNHAIPFAAATRRPLTVVVVVVVVVAGVVAVAVAVASALLSCLSQRGVHVHDQLKLGGEARPSAVAHGRFGFGDGPQLTAGPVEPSAAAVREGGNQP